jgi:hypothetical protein
MSDQNKAEGVGQDGTYKDAVDKYDAEHGKYQDNVPRTGAPVNIPNAGAAASDPSPFKLGPT